MVTIQSIVVSIVVIINATSAKMRYHLQPALKYTDILGFEPLRQYAV